MGGQAKRWNFMRLALLFLIGLALLGTGCSRRTVVPSGTIAFLGDSITAGYGLDPGEAYPASVKIPGMTMLNLGVSGSETGDGVDRLRAYLEGGGAPSLVVIALGGNDIIRGVASGQIEAHLNAMIKTCRERRVPVLLCGIRIPGKFDVKEIFQQVSETSRVPLYPDFMQDEFFQENYLQDDHVHPTAEGQQLIARGMQQALLQHFSFDAK